MARYINCSSSEASDDLGVWSAASDLECSRTQSSYQEMKMKEKDMCFQKYFWKPCSLDLITTIMHVRHAAIYKCFYILLSNLTQSFMVSKHVCSLPWPVLFLHQMFLLQDPVLTRSNSKSMFFTPLKNTFSFKHAQSRLF